ncbi:hypothetical protein PF003_g25705 [Phytophthora fragariae]|nr:hypothetical protein PF003_g25705 [Phytophthora fragariae]
MAYFLRGPRAPNSFAWKMWNPPRAHPPPFRPSSERPKTDLPCCDSNSPSTRTFAEDGELAVGEDVPCQDRTGSYQATGCSARIACQAGRGPKCSGAMLSVPDAVD